MNAEEARNATKQAHDALFTSAMYDARATIKSAAVNGATQAVVCVGQHAAVIERACSALEADGFKCTPLWLPVASITVTWGS